MAQEQSNTKIGGKVLPGKHDDNGSEPISQKDAEAAARRAEKLTEKLSKNLTSGKKTTRSASKASATSQDDASRRSAEPARDRIAANDDLPSIGGLIYALQQRPSRTPFYMAFGASIAWIFLCLGSALFLFNERLTGLSNSSDILRDPTVLTLGATLFIPIALFWFLAMLIWRAQELRLMASAMTEVAVRLAEPDKMAAQSVASLGQTIRRQVAAMNDAISRALGRAGELEALVHNEVAALERSYGENEHRIRGLIGELASEREALSNNSERVSETLQGIGSQVSKDISEAGDQATKSLASASSNIAATLTAKGNKITEALGAAGTAVDGKLAERGAKITQQLIVQGDDVTNKLGNAGNKVSAALKDATNKVSDVMDMKSNQLVTSLNTIGSQLVKDIPGLLDRLDGEQQRLSKIISGANQNFTALESAIAQRTTSLDGTLKTRTDELKTVLAERIKSLDTNMAQHAKMIESSLGEKSKTLQMTLSKTTQLLDTSLTEKTRALHGTLSKTTNLMESSLTAKTKEIEGTLSKTTQILDSSLTEKTRALQGTLSKTTQLLDTTLNEKTKAIEGSLNQSTMTLSHVFAEGADNVKKTTEFMAQQSSEASIHLTAQADTLKGVSHQLLDQVHGLTQRFETQGQAIMSASQALDSSNAQIDSILERRHAEISSLLETVSTKAQSLDKMMRSYSGIIEGSLVQVEERAKQITSTLAQDTASEANRTVAEIERLRTDARSHTEQAVAELTGGFQSVTTEVASQLGALTSRFDDTTREMRHTAASTSDEMELTRQELQRRMQHIPEAARHSQEAVRKAISDQLKALGTLSTLSTTTPGNAMPQPARTHTPQPPTPAPAPAAPPSPLYTGETAPQAYNPAPRAEAAQPKPDMASVTANLANRLGGAGAVSAQQPPPSAAQKPGSGLGVTMRSTPSPAQQDDRWSVGDLLARASEPDPRNAPPAPAPTAPPAPPAFSAQQPQPPQPQLPPGGELRLNDIASAIDQQAASTVWQRFRNGERDIFTRQLYTPQGQSTFDEIAGRYQRDAAFRSTVERYIGDFERLLADAERKGQNSDIIHNYLTSETGRVYLMLAHASGRLR